MTNLKSMMFAFMVTLTALSAPAQQATAWELPATYTGVLPCADCAGIVHTLTLRPDGLYFLRQTYLGKPGSAFSQAGGWQLNDSKNHPLASPNTFGSMMSTSGISWVGVTVMGIF